MAGGKASCLKRLTIRWIWIADLISELTYNGRSYNDDYILFWHDFSQGTGMSATYHNIAKEKINSQNSFQPKFKTCLFIFLQTLFYIIKILKSEEKVYSKVCIFLLSLCIQRGWLFFSNKRMGTACPSLRTYLSQFLHLYEPGYPLWSMQIKDFS